MRSVGEVDDAGLELSGTMQENSEDMDEIYSWNHENRDMIILEKITIDTLKKGKILTHYTIGHRGELKTHFHQTTFPSSPQSTYDMTTDCDKTDEHSQTTRSSVSSCHQTVVFHLSTQDFAVSLNFKRSSNVQGRARRVHCSMCAVFTCCVSIEVFPFLPMLLAACVTCT